MYFRVLQTSVSIIPKYFSMHVSKWAKYLFAGCVLFCVVCCYCCCWQNVYIVKCTNLACPLEKLYLLVSPTDIWVLLLPQQKLAFLANSFHWILWCHTAGAPKISHSIYHTCNLELVDCVERSGRSPVQWYGNKMGMYTDESKCRVETKNSQPADPGVWGNLEKCSIFLCKTTGKDCKETLAMPYM